MEIFDLLNLHTDGYEKEVVAFFVNELFKSRMIALEPGQKTPECLMDSFVIGFRSMQSVLNAFC